MKLRIFVAHPSSLLTDNRPHGDGLVAFGFIHELAARGHALDVATQAVDLGNPLPPNVRLHPLATGGGPAVVSRLEYMRRLRRLYRRLGGPEAFDVVHQLNPVDVGLSLALTGIEGRLVLGPYVPDWPPTGDGADAVVGSTTLRVKRIVRRAQQRRATTVLISTPAAASKVELPPPDGPLVRELSPGIDDRAFSPGGAGAGQEILFLANLEVRKGIHVLLDAFALLADRLPAARLLLAGAGSQADAVHRRVGELPAPEQVSLLGRVERDQIAVTMQRCAVYCLPSYGEPFGMTALEAMACGKPVVATDAGGLRHLVPDEGGRKVPPGDPEALAAALGEVLCDPELQRSMGEHNRSIVERRYAWPRLVDRLEEIYGEASMSAR